MMAPSFNFDIDLIRTGNTLGRQDQDKWTVFAFEAVNLYTVQSK